VLQRYIVLFSYRIIDRRVEIGGIASKANGFLDGLQMRAMSRMMSMVSLKGKRYLIHESRSALHPRLPDDVEGCRYRVCEIATALIRYLNAYANVSSAPLKKAV
jgi:hypothetical protein